MRQSRTLNAIDSVTVLTPDVDMGAEDKERWIGVTSLFTVE